MKKHMTRAVYSPGDGTAAVAKTICEGLAESTSTVDLLKGPVDNAQFGPNDLVLVAMPVFNGRLPAPAAERLKALQGADTPAVAVVVYGNRAYDDALLELCDQLAAQGFHVVGAAAFIAWHMLSPKVAQGRPDDADKAVIREFSAKCLAKLEAGGELRPPAVPGTRPYREGKTPALLMATGDNKCTKCGICVPLCPSKAINAEDPRKTYRSLCGCCGTCIYVCPVHARAFRGPVYKIGAWLFAKKYAARKEPEFFV